MQSRIIYSVLFLLAGFVLSGLGYYYGSQTATDTIQAQIEHIKFKTNHACENNKKNQSNSEFSHNEFDRDPHTTSDKANNKSSKKKFQSANTESIDTVVIHAITRGKWTKYDNRIFYSYMNHLNEKQRSQILKKLGDAINIQQMNPGFFIPSL